MLVAMTAFIESRGRWKVPKRGYRRIKRNGRNREKAKEGGKLRIKKTRGL